MYTHQSITGRSFPKRSFANEQSRGTTRRRPITATPAGPGPGQPRRPQSVTPVAIGQRRMKSMAGAPASEAKQLGCELL